MRRLAWALCGLLWASGAQATSPFEPLVPTAAEQVNARSRALAANLERLLSAWPGVEHVRVAVDLPDGSTAPLDAPLPPPAVSVVLRVRAHAPAHAPIEAAVRASAEALTHARVNVTPLDAAPRQASEPLVSVGPFRVARSDADALRLVLALSLLANVTLATVLLARTRVRARRRGSY